MLDAQLVKQLLSTMRYIALDAPRPGAYGDWCVRARRIGDPGERPMLVRFLQAPAVDRERLRPLRLDDSTREFLFPQQLLTLPGNIVATVRDFIDPAEEVTSLQLLQFCRKGARLLAFLREQNRVHGNLSAANLSYDFLFADAGWAWLGGRAQEDAEQLKLTLLGFCRDDELGGQLAQRLQQGWDGWSPQVVESADNLERVDAPLQMGEGRTLCQFKGDVLGLAFSADNRFLAAVGYEPFVQVVDLASGKLRRLDHNGTALHFPCFSPDGRWLAALDCGGVKLWHLSDGSWRYWGYRGPFTRLAFSLGGDLVVEMSAEVEVLRLPDGQPRLDLQQVQLAPQSGAVHPRLRLRAVGEHAGMTNYGGLFASVQIFDFDDQLLWSEQVCRDRVPSVCFSPDGSMLACGSSGDDSSSDYPVKLWSLL